MKDFYDIWLLSTTLDFDNEVLAAAIRETFKRRHGVAERYADRFDAGVYCGRNKETAMASFLKKEQAGRIDRVG